MSIAYRADRESGLIRMDVGGCLNDWAFIACIRAIVADSHVRPGMDVLIDLRDMTGSALTQAGMVRAAVILREPGAPLVRAKVALVTVERVPAHGFSNFLQGLLPKEVRIFDGTADAMDWLAKPEY